MGGYQYKVVRDKVFLLAKGSYVIGMKTLYAFLNAYAYTRHLNLKIIRSKHKITIQFCGLHNPVRSPHIEPF